MGNLLRILTCALCLIACSSDDGGGDAPAGDGLAGAAATAGATAPQAGGAPAAGNTAAAGAPAMTTQPAGAAGTPPESSEPLPPEAGAPAGPAEPPPPAAAGGALEGSCPDGFTPAEGQNVGFDSGGTDREFHVFAPGAGDGPRPLFVALTGTVQEEVSFAAQSGLDQLPADGWIVLSPVRSCSQEGRNCATVGSDGRVWEPWYDGTTPRSDDPGPDVAFVEAMIRCVATVWPVAADQIYAGGISAGGSFTNRNMTFNSQLFAGGVPASGNWSYGVPPASPMPMDPSIVIIVWGGPTDTWPGSPPYAGETKAAAEYYAAQPDVVTVSCSGTHGHAWPTAMTPWLASTLLSHPKGSDPGAFVLTEPPAGFSCVLGEYTDH